MIDSSQISDVKKGLGSLQGFAGTWGLGTRTGMGMRDDGDIRDEEQGGAPLPRPRSCLAWVPTLATSMILLVLG